MPPHLSIGVWVAKAFVSLPVQRLPVPPGWRDDTAEFCGIAGSRRGRFANSWCSRGQMSCHSWRFRKWLCCCMWQSHEVRSFVSVVLLLCKIYIHIYLSLYIYIYIFYSSSIGTIFRDWRFTHKILPGSSVFAGVEDTSESKSSLARRSITVLNHCILYSVFVIKAHMCGWNASWPT